MGRSSPPRKWNCGPLPTGGCWTSPAPESLQNNAFIESFNSRVRAECLNQHGFLSLEDAVEKVERWRVDYNRVRPHSAIGNLSPAQFAREHQNPGRVA